MVKSEEIFLMEWNVALVFGQGRAHLAKADCLLAEPGKVMAELDELLGQNSQMAKLVSYSGQLTRWLVVAVAPKRMHALSRRVWVRLGREGQSGQDGRAGRPTEQVHGRTRA